MDEILLEHRSRYPDMEIQDEVKLLYQREFGGGHMIADEAESLDRIKAEYRELAAGIGGREAEEDSRRARGQERESIGDGLYRVSLGLLAKGLSPETLNRMFVKTAREVRGNQARFTGILKEWLSSLHETGPKERYREAAEYLAGYEALGCPMVSHSSHYRSAYHPAYRIVAERYVKVLDICCDIDRKLGEKEEREAAVLVAIDGCSAGGKTTAAETLAGLYDANLFHLDDFFLRPEQRIPERFQEPGGNVDYERFGAEVLAPLLAGQSFQYRTFDCGRMALGNAVQVRPKRLSIIEGVYSRHPYFGDIYDLEYWFFVSPDEQKRRILERNGALMLERFVKEWIPLEHAYFREQGLDPFSGNPKTL